LDARATLQAESVRIGRARDFAGLMLDLGLDARATLQAASVRIGRARHFAGSVGSRIGCARDFAGREC
jgi:hypothetical protein